tara:strand:- start:8093 stop:8197 length:105 start_codon:yes stop_codon:yes gene_type:complete
MNNKGRKISNPINFSFSEKKIYKEKAINAAEMVK